MGNILLMTTIIDRKITKKYLELYQKNDLHVIILIESKKRDVSLIRSLFLHYSLFRLLLICKQH